jgi:PAS domain S-box-containing protein
MTPDPTNTHNNSPTRQQLEQRIAELEHKLADYEQQAPLRAILDAIPHPIFYKDADGVYRDCNQAFAHFHDRKRDAIIGSTAYDLAPPELAEQYHEADLALIKANEKQVYQAQVVDTTGQHHTVMFHKAPLRDNGHVRGLVGIMHDVSVEQLGETEYRRFFDLSLDMLCLVDYNGYFKRLNQTWMQTLGYTEAELKAEPFMSFVHPDDQEATMSASAAVFGGSDVAQFENRYRCKDGRYLWLEWQSAVVPDQQLIYAAARDITERKRVELMLRDNEERLTQYLNALPVGVFVADAQGRPHYANSVAQHILGKGIAPGADKETLAEVYSAYLAGTDELYPTDNLPIVRAMGGESTTISDMEVRHPEHRILLEVTGAPIYDSQGRISYALIAFNDITERAAAQEALQRQAVQEEVIRAQSATLRELSTPLLKISDSTLVMPLVGTIDSARAQQVMESLLEGIAEERATSVIMDITGVSVVDTQVANALLSAAQAARLLGTQVILSGIRPEIAQTIVGLGVDLSGLSTASSLQRGISRALASAGKQA